MALGVKYRLDYSDEQLISWRADILQEGYVGSITEVKMGGKPVTIEMRDIDDPFTPVCHTEATLTLVSESLGQFDAFKTADVYEYSLQVIRDSTLFWQGTLLTEPFTEAFESAPYEIELKFSDGLSELSYERYDVTGALQSGFTSVIEILVKCFDKLPISRGFREIINLFEDSMDDTDTEGLLEQLIIYEAAFWETDSDDIIKGEPALKVIEGIMYSLKCRLIVSKDTYYIMRISEAKTYGVVKYVDYDSTGTKTGNGTIDLRKSTSGRTEVLPDLLAHLSGATIDINKQYQEVEFIYSSKNITTINNSLLINANFNGGYELENGSPVPLYYGRSAAVNTVIGVTPTALHLDTVFIPFEIDTTGEGTDETNTNVLVMEEDLLINTKIITNPIRDLNNQFLASLNPSIPAQVTRETYYLFPESPADNTITYKNLLYSTDDHIEIIISGWFDYTYNDATEFEIIVGPQPMIFNKWTIKLGANYYNTGDKTWSTDTKSRAWNRSHGNTLYDELLSEDPRIKRHQFGSRIILENFPAGGTDDLEITWFIPETYRTPGAYTTDPDKISEMEIVFSSMEIKYVSDSSTEFTIQKVLGETGSTSLRTRRYKSEVSHGDGPSNFSIMSFRLPTTNLMTSLWSSRGGSESLPGYKWDIESIFENLGTYRIIFNGELYGLLEMHNIVNLIQETKILLIKGMRFDTKHNIYELKLHEVDSFTPPSIAYIPQFDLSAFTDPSITGSTITEDPIGAIAPAGNVFSQTTGESNTEAQSYTQSTHVQTNNDTSESAGDYPG